MTIYPVTESFAAEIGDLDLSITLSVEDRGELEAAFNCYSVLVFPDQHLSTDQHLEFARNFGPLETTIHAARSDAKLRVRAVFHQSAAKPNSLTCGNSFTHIAGASTIW